VDVESCECPRSLLEREPEAMKLLQRYRRAKRTHEATGGVMYGPDSSLWPARWVDAVTIIAGEEKRADAAFQHALADYRRESNRAQRRD
jgi:hypothetical protein